jgi:hypothetical protein
VTETRLDDDLVQQGRHPILFQSLLDIKNKKQQGRHPILFQSLLDIKNNKQQDRPPILIQSLLDIKNNKVVIQSCFSHY